MFPYSSNQHHTSFAQEMYSLRSNFNVCFFSCWRCCNEALMTREGCFVIQNHTKNVWKLFWWRNLKIEKIVKRIFPLELFCVFLFLLCKRHKRRQHVGHQYVLGGQKVYKGIVKWCDLSVKAHGLNDYNGQEMVSLWWWFFFSPSLIVSIVVFK